MCTAWTLFQCLILDHRFAIALNTQRKEVVDVFNVLDTMGWSQSPEVATERIKINGIPSRITPLFGLLNLKTLVISINMKAHTRIILTGDRSAVYGQHSLVVTSVVDHSITTKTAMFAIAGGKKIGINIETCGKRYACI